MIVEVFTRKPQLIEAGATISPGNQIRALTAIKAIPKRATINAGKTVVRKNPKTQTPLIIILIPKQKLN